LVLLFLFRFDLQAQYDQRIENIGTYDKIYGYVKHFHPSDEASAIDWDRFAIYGM